MKIEWNKVTWYSKLLALFLFILLPFGGFYLGTFYQRGISPQIQEATSSAARNPTPNPNPNPNPTPSPNPSTTTTITVKEAIDNAASYSGKKVKISGVVDIHSGGIIYSCPQNNQNCEQPKGTVFLKDTSVGSDRIQLEQGTISYYTEISCTSTTSPISSCAGHTSGSAETLEGTFVRLSSTNTSGNYIYILII